ncbi:MAG: hypothetical protein JWR80_9549 [Bradyrhizobium sp.]|nr:hypothetical protein [Bradyrhizobium sp.]
MWCLAKLGETNRGTWGARKFNLRWANDDLAGASRVPAEPGARSSPPPPEVSGPRATGTVALPAVSCRCAAPVRHSARCSRDPLPQCAAALNGAAASLQPVRHIAHRFAVVRRGVEPASRRRHADLPPPGRDRRRPSPHRRLRSDSRPEPRTARDAGSASKHGSVGQPNAGWQITTRQISASATGHEAMRYLEPCLTSLPFAI